jgi:hypothetical protein
VWSPKVLAALPAEPRSSASRDGVRFRLLAAAADSVTVASSALQGANVHLGSFFVTDPRQGPPSYVLRPTSARETAVRFPSRSGGGGSARSPMAPGLATVREVRTLGFDDNRWTSPGEDMIAVAREPVESGVYELLIMHWDLVASYLVEVPISAPPSAPARTAAR